MFYVRVRGRKPHLILNFRKIESVTHISYLKVSFVDYFLLSVCIIFCQHTVAILVFSFDFPHLYHLFACKVAILNIIERFC